MARPLKQGLDYFPLDCYINDQWQLIEAEFGIIGFGVIVKLLQKIYSQEGYYIKWTEDVALLFSRSVGLSINEVSNIVNAAIRRGIFNTTLYDKYQILTSAKIQEVYFQAVTRRTGLIVERAYLLVEKNDNIAIVDNYPVNVDNNPINESEKYTNKTRGNKTTQNRKKYGEYDNVLLSDSDFEKLKSEFPEDYEQRIENLSSYMASKGKSYKNHLATIRNWARRQTGAVGHHENFSPNSQPYILANGMYKQIQQMDPNFPVPDLQLWASAFSAMIESGCTAEDIAGTITETYKDQYWSTRISSPEDLKRSYGRIHMQHAEEIACIAEDIKQQRERRAANE